MKKILKYSLISVAAAFALFLLYFFFVFFPDDYSKIRSMALEKNKSQQRYSLIADIINQADSLSFQNYRTFDADRTLSDLKSAGYMVKRESVSRYSSANGKIWRAGTGQTGIWIDERRAIIIPPSASVKFTSPKGASLAEFSLLSVAGEGKFSWRVKGHSSDFSGHAELAGYVCPYTVKDIAMKYVNIGFPKAFDDYGWKSVSEKIDIDGAFEIEFKNEGSGNVFLANPRLFSEGGSEKYNIIYIVFDGVSSKFWSFYNEKSNSTLQMKKIADEDFIVFDNLFTAGNKTRLSSASLFTSVYPTETGHGINRNSIPQDEKDIFYAKLRDGDFASLPLVLSRNGYISEQFGNNGFTSEMTTSGVDYGFSSSFEFQYNPYDTIGISRKYFEFLKNTAGKTFFSYTHYNTTHKPFYSPAKYYFHALKNSPFETFWRPTYVACLNYGDDLFANIYASLKDKGLTENSIIVFATDHGSEYSFKKYMGGFLGNETTRMTFMIHLPKKLRADLNLDESIRRVKAFSSSIDIAPTLLDLAGVEIPSQFKGTSLKEFIAGRDKREFVHDYIWTFGRYDAAVISKDKMKYILTSQRAEKKFSYEHYFFGARTEKPFEELYDLKSDPDENRNLIVQNTAQLARFRKVFSDADYHHPERLVVTIYPSLAGKNIRVEFETSARPLLASLFAGNLSDKQDYVVNLSSGKYSYSFKKPEGYSHLMLRFNNDRLPVKITIICDGRVISSGRIAGTFLNAALFSNPLRLATPQDFHLLYADTLPPQDEWRYSLNEVDAKVSVIDLHRWIDLGASGEAGISAGMKEALKSWGYVQ